MVRANKNSNHEMKIKAYSVYFITFGSLTVATVLSGFFYFETMQSYFLLLVGGFLSGLTGMGIVVAQEIQTRSRMPKVFFHSRPNPKLLSRESGKRIFPIILRNLGYEPGQDILILAKIKCNQGNVKIKHDAWGEVTSSNVTASNELVFQRRIDRLVYPKRQAGEFVAGEITIEPDSEGKYEIEIVGEVYERKGSTRRKCTFHGTPLTSDKVQCEPEKEFYPYY
jgi:hypothetical protein